MSLEKLGPHDGGESDEQRTAREEIDRLRQEIGEWLHQRPWAKLLIATAGATAATGMLYLAGEGLGEIAEAITVSVMKK